MKRIDFVGGVWKEIAEIMEDNNIIAICLEDMTFSITECDYNKLQQVAPYAFEYGYIVTLG